MRDGGGVNHSDSSGGSEKLFNSGKFESRADRFYSWMDVECEREELSMTPRFCPDNRTVRELCLRGMIWS